MEQMVLIVGTKLQYIITEMAIRFCEKNTVVEGITSVKPTDKLFWLGKPHIILCLVHFILFQVDLEPYRLSYDSFQTDHIMKSEKEKELMMCLILAW
jgi:hypothetical protein